MLRTKTVTAHHSWLIPFLLTKDLLRVCVDTKHQWLPSACYNIALSHRPEECTYWNEMVTTLPNSSTTQLPLLTLKRILTHKLQILACWETWSHSNGLQQFSWLLTTNSQQTDSRDGLGWHHSLCDTWILYNKKQIYLWGKSHLQHPCKGSIVV